VTWLVVVIGWKAVEVPASMEGTEVVNRDEQVDLLGSPGMHL